MANPTDTITPAHPLPGPRAAETPLILASGSAVRARLLSEAGVAFGRVVAAIDEDELKTTLKAEGATATMAAETLAELKAQRVSRRHPDALVIGADQILECDGQWFDKPADLTAARASLVKLRGRSHVLRAAVSVVRGGDRLWHHNEHATLLMRNFGDGFLDAYLAAVGDAVLTSVGAYQLEGLGAQLFARIDGDYFTVLGLPLLPLLDFLRNHGVVGR
jgi:nucleoside triphosphate pyrophosphatase